jgi:glycerol-1-phosphate dehydrogenase [NAD(P)+]
MAGWGYGDLAGKIVAGADWLVADALGIEAIDDKAWPLIQDNLRIWLNHPEKVQQGDAATNRLLFTGLVMAGVAMDVYQSSRPASGADHQMAHLWEMEGIEFNGLAVSHGTSVALGTLTILGLYEWTLTQKFEHLDVNKTLLQRRSLADLETEIRQRFTKPAMAARILAETRAKYVDDNVLGHRLEGLRATWPDLRQRLAQHLIPFARMKSMLVAAGVATDPIAVGIDRTHHRQTILDALFIRRRYTILDLLAETGCLDKAVAHIFASGGYWA